MEYMLMPLKRYADFSGRSRRKEYWMFALGIFLAYIVIAILALALGAFSMNMQDGAASGFTPMMGLVFALFGILVLAIIVPSIAVQVRRFHDQDKSGWFALLNFVPYIGGIVVFVFMCLEGTKGPNRFGEDPKGATANQNVADIFS